MKKHITTEAPTRTKAEAGALLEEAMLAMALEELSNVVITPPWDLSADTKENEEAPAMVEKKEEFAPAKAVGFIARANQNPAFMAKVLETGAVWHLLRTVEWKVVDGKKKRVSKFAGVAAYEGETAKMPIHSPLKKFVDAGILRFIRIRQLDQDGKIFKSQKELAYAAAVKLCASGGYLVIQCDWKDSELQLFYAAPETLADFFGITLEKLYGSVGKLHKWLKLVKTPTKLVMESEELVRVLYVKEDDNQYGKPRYDGDIFVNSDLSCFKYNGSRIWEGFCDLLQMRSKIETGVLIKGLAIFSKGHFLRKARPLAEKYGYSVKRFDMIINQHSVKFDRLNLVDGQVYEFKACELFRFVGLRAKSGSSTLGAQLVAMKDMAIAGGILKEHGLMESALLIKALAKGMPYAWIHIANDYKKVDTNKFLELAFCVNRPQYGWRMAKMASLHNRNMSFLESECRKRIFSVEVKKESAYAYTDERCDGASELWFEARGEWKSFAVLPAGTTDADLNDKGEVASIKYPLHSNPCVASHTALRENIFDPESKLVVGLSGGLGLSTLYQRTVMGLDSDGDKLAKFKTVFSIPVEFDLSMAIEEEKGEVVPITCLAEACEETLRLAHGAAADTMAIGTIDLSLRYCFIWCHMNGVPITSAISAAVGALREGGIKGGVKGDTKGIANASTQLDIPASLEAGTLSQDIIKWFGELAGVTVDPLSGFGEVNKENLAELAHLLVVKGAGTSARGHGDKFLHRMQVLLPAYMAHKGDKKNNPWHDAFVVMSEGIKPEYLSAEKMDCRIIQNQYKEVWKLVESSFAAYGKEGLDYSFDLEQVKGFANWINAYYKNNSKGIQYDFRGVKDRETGEQLVTGDFDADRKSQRYIKLLRVIKFMLNGITPSTADLAFLPHAEIPANVMARCMTFADNSRDTLAYLKFAHIFIATTEFNVLGEEGNSGGMAWNFPAGVIYEARAMYYDSTVAGQKEVRNPFLALTKELAIEFDTMWMKRALDFVERNPNANDFVYPEADVDGFEEDEIAQEWAESEDDYDSIG